MSGVAILITCSSCGREFQWRGPKFTRRCAACLIGDALEMPSEHYVRTLAEIASQPPPDPRAAARKIYIDEWKASQDRAMAARAVEDRKTAQPQPPKLKSVKPPKWKE